MSRGLGRLERRILELLAPRRKGHVPCKTAREMAWVLHTGPWNAPISAAQRASVYQAMASLERKGLAVRIDGRIARWSLAEAQREQADWKREQEAKAAQRERARQRQEEKARQKAEEGAEQPQTRQPPARQPTDRLVRLLGMLGSAHDGEILNAARAAEAERRRLGRTWAELLDPDAELVRLAARWR